MDFIWISPTGGIIRRWRRVVGLMFARRKHRKHCPSGGRLEFVSTSTGHRTTATAAAPQRGFVLPLVLWLIAALGLVIAAIDTWVGMAVSNAQVLRDRTQSRLEMADVRNDLVYMIATRPMSTRGLEAGSDLVMPGAGDIDVLMAGAFTSNRTIAFDGRTYQSETHPEIEVKLFDGRGLLNLNDLNPARVDSFLKLFGYSDELRARLSDTLRDYIDEDDFPRLSGAEAQTYVRTGRRPPPNEALLTPYQATDIIGWSEAAAVWDANRATPLVTTCQSTGFNPNTAPERILMAALPRLAPENVRAIVESRRGRTFRNQREMSLASGVTLFEEPFFYSFSPGPCTIVEMSDSRTGDRVQFSLTIIPFSKTQPWRQDYELRIPSFAQPSDTRAPIARASVADQVSADIFPSPESVAPRDGLGSIAARPR